MVNEQKFMARICDMCLTESRSHAVESEWQGRQEAQSLPG